MRVLFLRRPQVLVSHFSASYYRALWVYEVLVSGVVGFDNPEQLGDEEERLR
jgi:hypothetical protein